MKTKNAKPIPGVEIVAYIEQLNALLVVCSERDGISIEAGTESIGEELMLLIENDKLLKPIELIGPL